jgi:murein L,D-transpeptidase YafK
LNRSLLARTLLASAALVAAIALAGCDTDNNSSSPLLSARALAPIPLKTLSEMAQKNMSKESPILVRLFKQESELEVWKEDSTGSMALLKTFPICRWSGDLGPKVREGDRQAPEGFYTITRAHMNPQSQYYLAFNLGFPNAFDRAHGRSGAHLMVHGDCSSRGCYSMTDEQIAEIYALARESFFGGQRSFQVQAFPFRMTPVNMAKHRGNPNMPFWKMLKEGYDHFEVTRKEPKVDVCERRYVFNAATPANSTIAPNFDPAGQCPVYEVPEDIVAAVAQKKQRDDTATAQLINRGTPAAPVKMATDGGMHEVFAQVLQGGRAVRGKDGEIERLIPVSAPGTIPPTVNPPSNVMIAVAPAPTPAAVVAAAAPTPVAAPRSNSIVRKPAQPAPAARPTQVASAAQPTQTASSVPAVEATRNFLSNLFTSNGAETQAASAAPSAPAQASKPVGLRGSTSTAAARPATQPAPAAKPKPAATAVAEAKPMPLPEPEEVSPKVANAGAIRPQSPVSAFNGMPDTRPAGSLLSGAAPVVPIGSFGTSWSTLR